jgi:hypothetical protein
MGFGVLLVQLVLYIRATKNLIVLRFRNIRKGTPPKRVPALPLICRQPRKSLDSGLF